LTEIIHKSNAAEPAAEMAEDTVLLEQEFTVIKIACINRDAAMAYASLSDLKALKWTATTAAFIDRLRTLLLADSDFDGALELINSR
jgi:hypothetical protein